MSESKRHFDKSRYRRQTAPATELTSALQRFERRHAQTTAWFGWRPALAGLLVLMIVTGVVLQPGQTPVEPVVSLRDETDDAATLARLELSETPDWSRIQRVAVQSGIADVSRFAGSTRSLSAIHTRVELEIPRLNHISLSELKPEES